MGRLAILLSRIDYDVKILFVLWWRCPLFTYERRTDTVQYIHIHPSPFQLLSSTNNTYSSASSIFLIQPHIHLTVSRCACTPTLSSTVWILPIPACSLSQPGP